MTMTQNPQMKFVPPKLTEKMKKDEIPIHEYNIELAYSLHAVYPGTSIE